MTTLVSSLLTSNQSVFSNKPLAAYQAGFSLQRATIATTTNTTSTCPCPTVTQKTYTSQNLSDTVFINLTMTIGQFTRCALDRANFTKSILAYYQFQDCSGDSANFLQVVMSDVSFTNCAFTYSTWNGASLQNVNFTGNLMRSEFSNSATINGTTFLPPTNLAGCIFNNSTLRHTAFDNIQLPEEPIFFVQSTIDGCSFLSANMPYITCTHARISLCEFTGAILTSSQFDNATISYSSFDACDLSAACFRGSRMSNTSLTNCVMGLQSSFENTDLNHVVFQDSSMVNVSFATSKLSYVDFTNAQLGLNAQNASDFNQCILTSMIANENTVFDYCNFLNATIRNSALNGPSMQSCVFNHAKLENVSFQDVDLSNSSFSHSTWSNVNFTNNTSLYNTYFVDSMMDKVNFIDAHLNEVVFDNSTLSNMNFTGADMIATSFFGARISDSNFIDAILSDNSDSMNSNAEYAANFENSELKRITFSGDSYLRFTVFTHCTLALSDFAGTSNLNPLDLREADFSESLIMDCSFQFCNFSNARFSNATLSRVHFGGCSLVHAEVDGVHLESCTADTKTILPKTWQRDSYGWIYEYDPGLDTFEEAKHQILTLGIANETYQSVDVVGHESAAELYDVMLADGTYALARRPKRLKIVQPDTYFIGAPVFVQTAPNHYAYGLIHSAIIGTTQYNIDYYSADAPKDSNSVHDQTSLFLEYFEYGNVVSVGVSPLSGTDFVTYRAIKFIDDNETPHLVDWFNGNQDLLSPSSIRNVNLAQPLTVTVGQSVFVLFQENFISGDDYYIYGQVNLIDVVGNHYTISVTHSGNSPNTNIVVGLGSLYLPA